MRPLDARILICRRKILCARSDLQELANHLLSPGLVDSHGVAQVRLLLRDGLSPLYRRPEAEDLEEALHAAIGALEVTV